MLYVPPYNSNDDAVKVYSSKVIPKTFKPKWEPIAIPRKLLGNGANARLTAKVFDHDKMSKNEIVGQTKYFNFYQFNRIALQLELKQKKRGTIIFSPRDDSIRQVVSKRQSSSSSSSSDFISESHDTSFKILQLYFRGKNLPNTGRGKIDPYVKLLSFTKKN